ncbi:MutS-related protein [Hathewaya histolytica]|uniref:MutS-related protein n=1 Tax=Hathewaya histolytica TaxID=1498 RepID=UPI003B675681
MDANRFSKKIKEHDKKILEYSKRCNLFSILRLITMISSINLTYRVLKWNFNKAYFLVLLLLYMAFIFLMIIHRRTKERLNFSKEIIEINKRYLSRITGKWTEFKDIGDEFIDEAHRYSSDLDIFGEKSLFQMINITNTKEGRESLAKSLMNPSYKKEEIVLRQEAIKELHDKLYLCEEMEYITRKHKDKLNKSERLIKYGEDSEVLIKSKILNTLIYTLPLITVPLGAFILLLKLQSLYNLIPIIIIIQISIWGINFMKLNNILGELGLFKYNIDTYVHMLKLIEKEEFKSQKLKSIKSDLFSEKNSALIAIKKLDNIFEKVNLRYNGLLYLGLNALLLWDYQCVFSLEAWKRQYGCEIRKWLYHIGEVESLMSLSVLTHIEEDITFPKINSEGKLAVNAKKLGHPLINGKDRIDNDVSMDNKIFIITGSNMSGKTTFLRTIGINLVLAYSGAPVFAREMTCSILDIFTSMRISDDLKNGISTFYAELIRIRDIIKNSNDGKKMIFLIDEIFRGTNSMDRILGAKNVLLNLNNEKVIGSITTHDLELCELDKYNRINNYHFSEYYKDDKIYFDYKIKDGKSTTTNAKYLMKIVGINIVE